MTDLLSADLGRIRLKNPIICAYSEFTMTLAGIRAALDAGARAVIAKSVNEAPGAARQLDIAGIRDAQFGMGYFAVGAGTCAGENLFTWD
jgi:hypothetical protein